MQIQWAGPNTLQLGLIMHPKHSRGAELNGISAGWVGEVEVEAYVVTIRNPAAADDTGILNPLLKRWKDQACSQMVFGLPAVRAVINFKWDR